MKAGVLWTHGTVKDVAHVCSDTDCESGVKARDAQKGKRVTRAEERLSLSSGIFLLVPAVMKLKNSRELRVFISVRSARVCQTAVKHYIITLIITLVKGFSLMIACSDSRKSRTEFKKREIRFWGVLTFPPTFKEPET